MSWKWRAERTWKRAGSNSGRIDVALAVSPVTDMRAKLRFLIYENIPDKNRLKKIEDFDR